MGVFKAQEGASGSDDLDVRELRLFAQLNEGLNHEVLFVSNLIALNFARQFEHQELRIAAGL